MLCKYAPQYRKFADKDGKAHGAYGPRIKPFLEWVVLALQQAPESRQVCINIWDNKRDLVLAMTPGACPDLPCTLMWQFLLRDGRLHMIVTMRSNDIWLGLPYDVFAFTTFQQIIASHMNVRVGTYTHQVGSMHLYHRNQTAAAESLLIKREPTIPITYRRDESLSSMYLATQCEHIARCHATLDPRYYACGHIGQTLVRLCCCHLGVVGDWNNAELPSAFHAAIRVHDAHKEKLC